MLNEFCYAKLILNVKFSELIIFSVLLFFVITFNTASLSPPKKIRYHCLYAFRMMRFITEKLGTDEKQNGIGSHEFIVMERRAQKGIATIKVLPLILGVSANHTICQNKLDFSFMLDSSGSVGKENFEPMKFFVKNLTYYYKLGLDEIRISVMSFSTKPVNEILFSRDLDRNRFVAAVDKIPTPFFSVCL